MEPLISLRPVQRNSYSPNRIVRKFLRRGRTNSGDVWSYKGLGQLTTDELSKQLKFLSILPHWCEWKVCPPHAEPHGPEPPRCLRTLPT